MSMLLICLILGVSKKFGVHHKGRIRLKACEHKLAGYLFHEGFTSSDILEQANLASVQTKKKKKKETLEAKLQ